MNPHRRASAAFLIASARVGGNLLSLGSSKGARRPRRSTTNRFASSEFGSTGWAFIAASRDSRRERPTACAVADPRSRSSRPGGAPRKPTSTARPEPGKIRTNLRGQCSRTRRAFRRASSLLPDGTQVSRHSDDNLPQIRQVMAGTASRPSPSSEVCSRGNEPLPFGPGGVVRVRIPMVTSRPDPRHGGRRCEPSTQRAP